MEDLSSIRKEYVQDDLTKNGVDPDPIVQFKRWFDDAVSAGISEPNVMTLATVADGRPSARIVLLKDVGPDSLTFFTNYASRKSGELDANPNVGLVFWWMELERQVRIEGIARRIDPAVSDEYFRSRPRQSQIGAWASPQSRVITSREELEARVREFEERFDGEVPRPDFWGGYVVRPETIEFWQGRIGRLHDRIRYRKAGDGWVIDRLAP